LVEVAVFLGEESYGTAIPQVKIDARFPIMVSSVGSGVRHPTSRPQSVNSLHKSGQKNHRFAGIVFTGRR
jgi:hypothetical protein